MRRAVLSGSLALLVLAGWLAMPASAGVSVAIPKQYAYPANSYNLSALAWDPALDTFITAGYGNNNSIWWSHVLNDTTTPWEMEGDVRIDWFLFGIFARAGYPSNVGTLSFWGVNFNPTNGKYYFEGIASLKGPSGSTRLATEPDITIYDPRLPDSLAVVPTGVTLSNAGGIYSLVDASINPGTGQPRVNFITSGVQAGDRITLYPVDTWSAVTSDFYTVTQVVSATELRLDRDPVWAGQTTATDVGYLLSLQPHVTLGTFRQVFPYYATNVTTGPKTYTGGLSPDGQTLYVAEATTGGVIAVSTTTHESFSVYVPQTTLYDYVQAQAATGRLKAINQPAPVSIYANSLTSGWADQSVGTTVNLNTLDPNYPGGTKSIAVTYNAAGSEFILRHTSTTSVSPDAADFAYVRFAIHGGATGGQTLAFHALDDSGSPGPDVTLTPPTAATWTVVDVPVSQLGVARFDGLVWKSTAAAAQPTFYVDEIALVYTTPPPTHLAEFDPNNAQVTAGAQIATDSAGRVWFTEGETDDLLWTTDGVQIHTLLTSNQIQSVTGGGSTSTLSTGVQFLGLTVDPMGTVYWSDNSTRGIWKAPACGGVDNIRLVASGPEIAAAIGLPVGKLPRGMNCFTIRNGKLLTYNYVDVEATCIYQVDLNSFQYGDFSADLDVDSEDLGWFGQALAGPDVVTPPPGCSTELFEHADLAGDSDVDLADFAKLQQFASGAL